MTVERLLEKVSFLVEVGAYPSTIAARCAIHRRDLPEGCIVRRGRRLFLRPDAVRRWIEEGMPRPERPEFVKDLITRIPYYNQRHNVKPGLTGWAQLKYPYGASEEDAMEKLKYDFYYVKHRSFLLDLNILVQTVEVVLFGKGR